MDERKEERTAGSGTGTGIPSRGIETRVPPSGMQRRAMLKLMGASLALAAGAPGCVRKPPRDVVSRERAPEGRLPGVPLVFASTWTEGRFPYGILVKTVDGRPVKVDGNPDHPVNRGGSSAAMQGAVLSLYDPSRLTAPRGAASWDEADRRIVEALSSAKSAVLVTRPTLGPSEREVLAALLARRPALQAFFFEPAGDRPRRAAWRDLFGRDGEWVPRIERARVVLSVGSDFLATDGVELEATAAFADARAADDLHPDRTRGCRLYVAEGDLSLTGMNADHHLRLRPSAYPAFLHAVREAVTVGGASATQALASGFGLPARVAESLARDLAGARGQSVVLAGGALPAAAHAEAALLNAALDAFGRTLEWNPNAFPIPDDPARIEAAIAGADVLILLGVNPVHSWPGGGFEAVLRKARLTVAHVAHEDETAAACAIALPSSHNLESWNDAEPRPGLASIGQPAVMPFHDARQEAASLMAWAGTPPGPTGFRDLVRRRFERDVLPAAGMSWQDALRTGVAVRPVPPVEAPPLDRAKAEELAGTLAGAGSGFEVELRPHPAVDDGRFGTHPWLLELPDPVSRLCWDNALRLAPKTAAAHGVATGDVVSITAGAATVELPVLVVPGVADGVGGIDLGFGRVAGGERVAGFDAWPLAPRDGGRSTEASVRPTGRRYDLALAQTTFDMQGRRIVLSTTLDRFRSDPDVVQRARSKPVAPSLYDHDQGAGPKWEMAIDLE
ncbi:MAG: hypothetical protein FJ087_22610, partial [Deltaproteobacteria bacterium]|nr:hypothetical protein [Deltaproteobacteria bacterium]